MGRKPKEEELREEGAAVLDRIKGQPPAVKVDMAARAQLLAEFGETEGNIDLLLSLGEGDV